MLVSRGVVYQGDKGPYEERGSDVSKENVGCLLEHFHEYGNLAALQEQQMKVVT